jgi:phage gp36-like protein
MADAYAIRQELLDFVSSERKGQVPNEPEANRLLIRASELIDEYVSATYAVSATGTPSDSTTHDALRDACCAQVEFWLYTGEETDIEGVSGEVSIGAAVSFTIPGRLGKRAQRILHNAGLLRPTVDAV